MNVTLLIKTAVSVRVHYVTQVCFFPVQETSFGDDIWPKLEANVISGLQQVD